MNWKMTAKTILVQLHHKVATFEHTGKHLVLAAQDDLIEYMRGAFTFDHLQSARLGDPVHLHSYRLALDRGRFRLELAERCSTDAQGIARCLGLLAPANVELDVILKQLEAKLPQSTPLALGPVPPPPILDAE
jgi:hypothetical protein